MRNHGFHPRENTFFPRYISTRNVHFYKVGCVFPIITVSLLPHAEFGPNDHCDHCEDAPHFISMTNFDKIRTMFAKMTIHFHSETASNFDRREVSKRSSNLISKDRPLFILGPSSFSPLDRPVWNMAVQFHVNSFEQLKTLTFIILIL